MATAIQWRRGTTSQHSSFTGLVGEITVDTDLDTIRVHDGSTAGGHRLAKYSEIGDITAVTAGDGLSGGGTSGALSIALDLNELTAATVAVDADSIAIIDAGDNSSKKESIADFVSAIAGSGLSASSGQLSISETGDISAVTAGDGLSGGGSSGAVSLALDLNELTAATVAVDADSIPIIDASDNSSKKESIADLVSGMAGTNLTASSGTLGIASSVIRGLFSAGGDLSYNSSTGAFTFTNDAGDIEGVTAGNGLSGGGTSGTVSLAVNDAFFDKTAGGTGFGANFEPAANNTHSLGSATSVWKDVYIGPGSLYINGQKVLDDSSGTIQVSANANQNVGIITSGSGDVEINASGTGTINLQSGITVDSGQVLTGTGGLTMGSNINLNSNYINNLGTPNASTDAATKAYVDTQIATKDALSELSGDTDDITEGTTNLFHTTARARAAISAGGDLSYNSSTGVISFTNDAGDIEGVTAGDGLSGGGSSGTVSLALDLNELTAAAVDVSADSIAIIDAGDNSSKKESIADLATAMAGTGIDASSGAFAVDSTVVVTSGTQTVGGNKTFSNDIVVSGNLTVSGTTTTINTETLLLEDNIITLNSGTSGAPSQNSGLTVDRGSSADVFLQFNETSDTWQFTNDGSTYINFATDTDGLSEGSTNLYYTNTRADARVDAGFSAKSTTNLSEGTNLYYTDERVADKIGGILTGSGNISVTYDDAADTITVSEALTTTDIAEGDNLYYTNARADARIANAIKDEDNFASDSATHVPSQQSVKAYIATQIATKDALSELSGDTDDISEGSSNLYFTNARADARITNALKDEDNMASDSATHVPSQQSVKAFVEAQVASKDALSELSGNTDDVSEGSSNLYFTNARADARIAAADTDSLSEGSSNQYHTSARVNTLIDARVTNSFVDALNVDADTLDSLDSGSFLRSDANDTHSGTITPNADNSLDLGSGSLRYNQVFAVSFEGTATSAKYADLAEKYETDEEIEAGSVVIFGGEKEITECDSECDHRVAGVISTDPAYMMNSEGEGQYLALTGRVPCKVTGPVAKGDLLVTSSTKGHATVDNNAQPGRIIGKAVGSSEGGEAVIEVLVNMM